MRLVLARVGIPMLVAAAILLISNLTAARADPASGEELRCNGPHQITPEISVKTCTYYFWWDYQMHDSMRARVTVRNSSRSYPVYVRPDLLVGSAVYIGNTYTIEPGVEREVWGNPVHDIPGCPPITGRGYIEALSWSTFTHGPSFCT